MRTVRGLCFLIVVIILSCRPDIAFSHAVLVESSPRQGEALLEPPDFITLQFNSKLELNMVRVKLVDARQTTMPLTLQDSSEVDRIFINVPRLPPGVYTLFYTVMARDGHVSEGMLRFTVLKP